MGFNVETLTVGQVSYLMQPWIYASISKAQQLFTIAEVASIYSHRQRWWLGLSDFARWEDMPGWAGLCAGRLSGTGAILLIPRWT
jgi:hypothetical protein